MYGYPHEPLGDLEGDGDEDGDEDAMDIDQFLEYRECE